MFRRDLEAANQTSDHDSPASFVPTVVAQGHDYGR